MGLDISAYSNLKLIDVVFDEDHNPIDPITRKDIDPDHFQPYFNSHFPGRELPLTKGVYLYDDSFGFRAGSYGGYNLWREKLAKVSDWALGSYKRFEQDVPSYCSTAWNAKEGPFIELINFSDCEGVIGSIVSTKLAKDFADFQPKADLEDEHFRYLYSEWRKAFELASKNGAVAFH